MWPYTDEEIDFLSLPKKSTPNVWDKSGWYWERYKDKCLNELAPLKDMNETRQAAQPLAYRGLMKCFLRSKESSDPRV